MDSRRRFVRARGTPAPETRVMKRAGTKRHPAPNDGAITPRPAASVPDKDETPAENATPAAGSGESGRLGWGWRLALFIWATSFVFLFLYELLTTLFLSRK